MVYAVGVLLRFFGSRFFYTVQFYLRVSVRFKRRRIMVEKGCYFRVFVGLVQVCVESYKYYIRISNTYRNFFVGEQGQFSFVDFFGSFDRKGCIVYVYFDRVLSGSYVGFRQGGRFYGNKSFIFSFIVFFFKFKRRITGSCLRSVGVKVRNCSFIFRCVKGTGFF